MDKEKNKQMDAEMSAALFSERERFEMLFAENWKKVAVIGVLIALVVALAFVAWRMADSADRRAAHAFADAADIASLEKALAENGSKKGALAARQRLVQLCIEAKKYDTAVKELKLIAADPEADSTVRGNAALSEAFVMELQGKNKEAAALFSKAAANTNYGTALRLEAAAAAGRLLAPVDPKAALDVLERASRLVASNQMAAQALSTVKDLKIALENGELGPKPAARTQKAK